MTALQTLTPVTPINPVLPYVGGKRLLAKRLSAEIDRIPHRVYVEPFCGMGGVFFRRTQRPKSEVINDLSRDVSNFFRVVRKHPDALVAELKYHVTCRDEFEHLKRTPADTLTDIERAARFFYLQKCSFGGNLTHRSFGVSVDGRGGRFSSEAAATYIETLHARLQAVTVEALPYDDILRRYDSPATLFYLDPPYWGCETDYGKDLFAASDFQQLADQLAKLKGRFIMSINNVPEIRNTFGEFTLQEVQTTYSRAKGTSKSVGELDHTELSGSQTPDVHGRS